MFFLYTGSIFLLGLFILIKSSDFLVDSCARLAFIFRLAPLFIGLVLVAFGTSAPEAGVSIMAVLEGQKAMALGNILGSNIANIGLVIGVCCLFFPMPIDKQILRRQVPYLLFATFLLIAVALDGCIGRLDGVIMLFFLSVFIFLSWRNAKVNKVCKEIKVTSFIANIKSVWVMGALIILFLVGIVIGAGLMVRAGIAIANKLGVSPWIIGVTVLAVGTSLPELAASLTASMKKVQALSIGNVIGSNIFNILFVLGLVAVIRPIAVSRAVMFFELPVLVLFTLVFGAIMVTGKRITRIEACFLLIAYFGFIGFLFK